MRLRGCGVVEEPGSKLSAFSAVHARSESVGLFLYRM